MDKATLGYFWQRPRTHREPIVGREVSSLELFYDLIYVVLIARVAEGLHGRITVGAVGTFAVLFGLLWIGWYNGSILHDAHGRPDVRNRLLTFLQMLALASMAVFAPDASGAGGFGFAASYLVVLLVLGGQWVVVARLERDDPLYGPIARRYTLLMIIMTSWVAASLIAPPGARLWMWAAYALAWVSLMGLLAIRTPREAPDSDLGRPLATDSLLERFGLFVIIVLGEVVAGVVGGLGAVEHLTVGVFATGLAGLGVAIAFWWTYFDMIGPRPPAPTARSRYLYNLVQLPLGLAITGVGGVTVSLIEGQAGHGPADLTSARWAFAGFVALALVSASATARLLAAWHELAAMFRPATIAGLGVGALALLLAALGASPLVLTSLIFVAMCAQWALAVRGWLQTSEGQHFIAEAAATAAGPR